MINDDVLIKFYRRLYPHLEWIQKVRNLKTRLKKVKLGFPGIGNDHISLVQMKDIREGDIFIHDPYLFNSPEEPDYFYMTAMYRKINDTHLEIEGIGKCENLSDPDRIYKWKDTVMNKINEFDYVLRVDVRPTENGGPGYYYFYKSYRDFRY